MNDIRKSYRLKVKELLIDLEYDLYNAFQKNFLEIFYHEKSDDHDNSHYFYPPRDVPFDEDTRIRLLNHFSKYDILFESIEILVYSTVVERPRIKIKFKDESFEDFINRGMLKEYKA